MNISSLVNYKQITRFFIDMLSLLKQSFLVQLKSYGCLKMKYIFCILT